MREEEDDRLFRAGEFELIMLTANDDAPAGSEAARWWGTGGFERWEQLMGEYGYPAFKCSICCSSNHARDVLGLDAVRSGAVRVCRG